MKVQIVTPLWLAVMLLLPGHARALPTHDDALQACTRIQPRLQRLACFDEVAGTPLANQRASSAGALQPLPDSIRLVAMNEKARVRGDDRFRISQPAASGGRPRVVISAPARDSAAPRPLLAISCLDAITRVQFIVHPPVAPTVAEVELWQDGRMVVPRARWQVLESGRVIDAGRGLVGIDVLRRLTGASRIDVRSDLPALDGLTFDSEGLTALIDQQREACRW